MKNDEKIVYEIFELSLERIKELENEEIAFILTGKVKDLLRFLEDHTNDAG